MTRQILALVLSTLLGGNCFGKGQTSSRPSPKEQAQAIAANSPVAVTFLDDSKQQGWISKVSDAGFVLSHEKKRQMEKSQISFAQVQAVKLVKDLHSHKQRNILIGLGVGIVFGAIALLLAAGTSYGRST